MSDATLQRRRLTVPTGGARVGLGLTVVVALVLLGVVLDLFSSTSVTRLLILAGLAASWNIVGGLAGQLHLGHAMFFGLSAYAAGWTLEHVADAPLLAIVAGAAAAGAASLALIPLFRADHAYFAIGTLTVVVLVQQVAVRFFPGGRQGLFFPSHPASSEVSTTLLLVAGLAVCAAATYGVSRGRVGLDLHALKADASGAQLAGVNVLGIKLAMFAISGALAGIFGALYAVDLGYVDPASVFLLNWSILPLLAVLIGGIGSVPGPLLGVLIAWEIDEIGRVTIDSPVAQLVVEGLLFLTLARWAPQGIIGLMRPPRRVPRDAGRQP